MSRPTMNPIMKSTRNILFERKILEMMVQQLRHGSFLRSNKLECRNNMSFTSEKERTKTVSAYYNQPAVDAAAAKVSDLKSLFKQRWFEKNSHNSKEKFDFHVKTGCQKVLNSLF